MAVAWLFAKTFKSLEKLIHGCNLRFASVEKSQKSEESRKGRKTFNSSQIDNSNIKSSSLNRSKLHLNKSGTALLTKIVHPDWLYGNINGQVDNHTKGISSIASNVSHLGNLRSKNPKNIIFSYININSIRNKFENLCDIVGNNVDVLSIAETKLDSSFPNAQFLLPGFHKPLRLDIIHRSGGLLVYIKASLPSKILISLNCL